ncbi:F-box-like domain superfamily [Arabidopsis thaliana x Arabidopsis arenosa]|uniref:Tubby-like F-box protein n=1 Tax=Arabidopsis thaliana x Arabidopsis arenosa TaxID=1240361 RepID=A0A8T2AZ38_9BRAS|nr:F-box-like domain superfamily [Arabidopsis thaliana x Arabidopsis arenosa]
MSLKSILRDLKEVRDGLGGISKRSWSKSSHIAPDQTTPPPENIPQSPWASLPPELLHDIIRRVEESETAWPARAAVVSCASVCKSWRGITMEIVRIPELCGKLTFPISLKQPGPRDSPIQCFIKRNRATATYILYYGLMPSESENDKLLLAARRIRRATCTDFIISLSAKNFSRSSSTYVGKLRSGFLGTKFTIYDNQTAASTAQAQPNRRLHPKQAAPKLPASSSTVGNITYELNVLRTRGPRRMHCAMDSIPLSSVITEPSVVQGIEEEVSSSPSPKGETSTTDKEVPDITPSLRDQPLVLKNKSPRWHEQLQCWCLNFKGRVTVASVKNFQLVADIDASLDAPPEEHERVILQFGKIGKDIFTMDYRYPLSAFQAFAICISSFDTKPACEG